MAEKPEEKVYIVTSKGSAELNGANSLTPAELKLLVLVDGYATVGDIAKRSEHGLDPAAATTTLEKMAKAGYVADPDSTAAINIGDFLKETDLGVASLQANGFFVRIARRGPPRPKDEGARKFTVMAVEDDPQLTKLLRTYLQMEGFAVRIAATREEINKALREPPKPDVLLLDVVLPDSDGFELLERMRSHEFLKSVPIIMATAKASREAVLNGLRRGCDGYVTKPYDMAVLIKAVRTVLNLPKRSDHSV